MRFITPVKFWRIMTQLNRELLVTELSGEHPLNCCVHVASYAASLVLPPWGCNWGLIPSVHLVFHNGDAYTAASGAPSCCRFININLTFHNFFYKSQLLEINFSTMTNWHEIHFSCQILKSNYVTPSWTRIHWKSPEKCVQATFVYVNYTKLSLKFSQVANLVKFNI